MASKIAMGGGERMGGIEAKVLVCTGEIQNLIYIFSGHPTSQTSCWGAVGMGDGRSKCYGYHFEKDEMEVKHVLSKVLSTIIMWPQIE